MRSEAGPNQSQIPNPESRNPKCRMWCEDLCEKQIYKKFKNSNRSATIASYYYFLVIFPMSCTTIKDPSCNAFYEGKESMPTICLSYGYYINWGKPNYNPRRVDGLKDKLIALGYSVQLAMDEEKQHFVSLVLEGKVICGHEDMQHNRNYRNLGTIADELVDQFSAAV